MSCMMRDLVKYWVRDFTSYLGSGLSERRDGGIKRRKTVWARHRE